MKKLLFTSIIALLTACSEADQGKHNACQYVREQIPNQADNIKSVEVVGEDSLLSDIILAFEQGRFAKAGNDYWQGNISREEYRKIIDEHDRILQDIFYSWAYSAVTNDSLRGIRKYDSCWRKVYTVRVTMKSGDTHEPRVMMDNDGITPYIIEKDMEMKLEEYQRHINQANEDCLFGKP